MSFSSLNYWPILIVITTMAVNHAFQGQRGALTLTDGGHWLGVLLIQGAILGWWGVG